jgi:modification methylase
MTGMPTWAIHHGNGASMWHLEDGSVDLVLTSPPYYPDELERELRRPLAEQTHVDEVEMAVTTLALSLQPVFHEIARVLKPAGQLIVQTRDLRYGGFLIGPLDVHRRLAEVADFRLVADVAWEATPASFGRERTVKAMWSQGRFVTAETERFMIFSRTPLAGSSEARIDAPAEYAEPIWKLPAQGRHRTHPHESPKSVLRRLIELHTRPGDLVADPLCGHGTVVLVALELGRSGIGYDIDEDCVREAREKLAKATGGPGGG